MTDRQLAVRAVGEAQRGAAACKSPHPLLRLMKPASLHMLAACVAALAIIDAATVQAKQHCSAVPASGRGYWSWRMIDGRKCWYEGKPMLSKSLLEWPARAVARPHPKPEIVRVPVEKPGNPLDAQAYAPDDSATFEALWRERIEKH